MTNLEFRALRSKAGVSQARVAVRAELDRARLCLWENGDLSLRDEEVQLLEKALGELISERADEMSKLVGTFESRKVAVG